MQISDSKAPFFKAADNRTAVNGFLNLCSAYQYMVAASFAFRECSIDPATSAQLDDAMKLIHDLLK